MQKSRRVCAQCKRSPNPYPDNALYVLKGIALCGPCRYPDAYAPKDRRLPGPLEQAPLLPSGQLAQARLF